MTDPVSVRLDDDTRRTLATAAKSRGVGLSTYLRDLAADEARRLRKARIRARSRDIAAHIERDPSAHAFNADWTKPAAIGRKK